MKIGLALMALPLALFALPGCETLTQTPAENGNQMVHAISTTGSEIPDDVQELLLIDRPSWLSSKPVPDHIINYDKVYPKGTPYYFKDNP